MRSMTKSVVRLAREASAVGRAALPRIRAPARGTTSPSRSCLPSWSCAKPCGPITAAWSPLVAEWGELHRALRLRRVPSLLDPLLCGAPTPGGVTAGRRWYQRFVVSS